MASRPPRMTDPLYSMMQPPRPPAPPAGGPDKTRDPNYSWIDEPAETVHHVLPATIKRVLQMQSSRMYNNLMMASLYSNEDLTRGSGDMAPTGVKKATEKGAAKNMPRQTENLIKAYTDTIVGKLMQSNSRVQGMTAGGDWSLFKLVRKLDMLLDSTRLEGGYTKEMPRVALDAVVSGMGHLYIDDSGDTVKYERWYPNEVFVDPYDAMYGAPSMMFRMRYMKRENALAQYGSTPEFRDIISKAPLSVTPTFAWTPYESGMISLYEAWAWEKPNREGRHILCVESGILNPEDTSWEFDHPPVVSFKVSSTMLGWHGQGFTPHVAGAQLLLNANLTILGKAAKLGIAPYWVVSGGATVSLKQISNAEGRIMTSTGAPPQYIANQPFHPDVLTYNDSLRQGIRAVYGISDIEAMGSSPQSRYDSDPALTRLQDAWMARHTVMLSDWSEVFHVELAQRTIEAAQRIAERRGGTYPVLATKGERAMTLDWADYKALKRNHYRLHLATESALPLSMPGRIQTIQSFVEKGMISPEEGMSMIRGSADVEAITRQITAYENNADWIVEELMEGRSPEVSELQKPEVVLSKVRACGLLAHENGAPEDVIHNFEVYAARLLEQVKQQQAELLAQQQAMMAQQQGAVPNGGPTAV